MSQKKRQKTEDFEESPFSRLIADLWARTFQYIPVNELLEIRRTCQIFQEAFENPVSIISLTDARGKSLPSFIYLFGNFVFYRTKNIEFMDLDVLSFMWVIEIGEAKFPRVRTLNLRRGKTSGFTRDHVEKLNKLEICKALPNLVNLNVAILGEMDNFKKYYGGGWGIGFGGTGLSFVYIFLEKEIYGSLTKYRGPIFPKLLDVLNPDLRELSIRRYYPDNSELRRNFQGMGDSDRLVKVDLKRFLHLKSAEYLDIEVFSMWNAPQILDIESDTRVERTVCRGWTDGVLKYPFLTSLSVIAFDREKDSRIQHADLEEMRFFTSSRQNNGMFHDTSTVTRVFLDLPKCKRLLLPDFDMRWGRSKMHCEFVQVDNLVEIEMCVQYEHVDEFFEAARKKMPNLKEARLCFNRGGNFFAQRRGGAPNTTFVMENKTLKRLNIIDGGDSFKIIRIPSLKHLKLDELMNDTVVDCENLKNLQIEWNNRVFNLGGDRKLTLFCPNLEELSYDHFPSVLKLESPLPKLKYIRNINLRVLESLIEQDEHIAAQEIGVIPAKTRYYRKDQSNFKAQQLFDVLLKYKQLKTFRATNVKVSHKKVRKTNEKHENLEEFYVTLAKGSKFPFNSVPQMFPEIRVFKTSRLYSFSKADLNVWIKKDMFKNLNTIDLKLGNEELRKIPLSTVYTLVLRYTKQVVNFSLTYDSHIDDLTYDIDFSERQQLLSLRLDNEVKFKGKSNLKYLSLSCEKFRFDNSLRGVEKLNVLELRKCMEFDVMNEVFIKEILKRTDPYVLIFLKKDKRFKMFKWWSSKVFSSYQRMQEYRSQIEKHTNVDFDQYSKLQKKFEKNILIFDT